MVPHKASIKAVRFPSGPLSLEGVLYLPESYRHSEGASRKLAEAEESGGAAGPSSPFPPPLPPLSFPPPSSFPSPLSFPRRRESTPPDVPRPQSLTFPGVVLCHPHPLYGGSMDSNVLDAIVAALTVASIAALKFNFRGVGGSEGTFDNGIGEQDDLAAAIDYLSRSLLVIPQPPLGYPPEAGQGGVAADTAESGGGEGKACLGVVGYSFGGAVALNHALRDGRVKALALVSPAIRPSQLVGPEAWDRPLLVISGAEDTVVPAGALEALRPKVPASVRLEIMAGVDHFWSGREDTMADAVAAFFRKSLSLDGRG